MFEKRAWWRRSLATSQAIEQGSAFEGVPALSERDRSARRSPTSRGCRSRLRGDRSSTPSPHVVARAPVTRIIPLFEVCFHHVDHLVGSVRLLRIRFSLWVKHMVPDMAFEKLSH